MASKSTPWLMLAARPALFLATQVIFAFVFLLVGSSNAWDDGADWWLLSVALADLICLVLLVRIFKAEGQNYWDLFRINRPTLKGDLLAFVIVTIIMAPVASLPNTWLANAFFGDPQATFDLIVRPLPIWVVYAAILLFSIGQGITELPNYFGYIMPRLESQGLQKWLAVTIPALVLGLQHVFAPLLFDIRFIAWRGLMFIPFAFIVGISLHWRPRLLPYFIVVHILMDMSFAAMFLSTAF